ncbi:alpha/beta fold hydrolase [Massilia sp. ST3]|uniref:alpha/beta fold hydrolase n=1 Tax=Massilia sp. ST3 TaxID=2824903 RepID=UPI001B81E7B1|nr:alpha/beta fold hydrolase [Massilia sp. ST3]MBQ5950193.1 alpha/beta fold hydrolase [Massilia sp. ST3]
MKRLRPLLFIFLAMLAAVAALVLVAPAQVTAAIFSLDRARSGLERKELVLPGGQRMVYLEGGQGEPLLLLHGFRGNKDHFTRVGRFLTGRYRVIVPDLPGFGESVDARDAAYTPAAQARTLHAFAQRLGADRAHLGGSSMGGQIALHYAALYPGAVRSLWLLAPNGVPGAQASELAAAVAAGGPNLLMASDEDEFDRLFQLVMADPPFMPRFVRDVLAQESLRRQSLHERIYADVHRDRSLGDALRAVKAPALVVWGEQDRVLDVSGAAALGRLLPRARVIVMPGVGHLPTLEREEGVARDYLAFLGALERG